MAKTGTPVQRRRRGRRLEYDPASGTPWRTTASFDPDNAVKIIEVINRIHPEMSAATVLNCLTKLMPTSAEDEPLTWPRIEAALREVIARFDTPQEVLPLTG